MTGKSHRTIGYLRVSTGTQDLKKNRAEILAFANEKDLGRVEFVETVLDVLGADDILIVSELSRIRRSMLDCMEILAIAAKREIRVYAIKGNCHLDETIQSKIMAMVFSMATEVERGLISARDGRPACRTVERPRQKQTGQAPFGPFWNITLEVQAGFGVATPKHGSFGIAGPHMGTGLMGMETSTRKGEARNED